MANAAAFARTPALVLKVLGYEANAFLLLSAEQRRLLQAAALEVNPLVLRFLPHAMEVHVDAAVLAAPEVLLSLEPGRASKLYARLVQPTLTAFAKGQSAMPYRQAAAALVFQQQSMRPTFVPRHHGAAGKRVVRTCVKHRDSAVLRALLRRQGALLRFAGPYRSCRRAVLSAVHDAWPFVAFKYAAPQLRRDLTFVRDAFAAMHAPNTSELARLRAVALNYARLDVEDMLQLAPLLTCRALRSLPRAALENAAFVQELLARTGFCICRGAHEHVALPPALTKNSDLVRECYRCGHDPGRNFAEAVPQELWESEPVVWCAVLNSPDRTVPLSFWAATRGLSTPELLTRLHSALHAMTPYANLGEVLLDLASRAVDAEALRGLTPTLKLLHRHCGLIGGVLDCIIACKIRSLAVSRAATVTLHDWMKPHEISTLSMDSVSLLRQAEDVEARASEYFRRHVPLVMCALDFSRPPHAVTLAALQGLGFRDPQAGAAALARLWLDS